MKNSFSCSKCFDCTYNSSDKAYVFQVMGRWPQALNTAISSFFDSSDLCAGVICMWLLMERKKLHTNKNTHAGVIFWWKYIGNYFC